MTNHSNITKRISALMTKYLLILMIIGIGSLLLYGLILYGFSYWPVMLLYLFPLLICIWIISTFNEIFINDKNEIIIKKMLGNKIIKYRIDEIDEIYSQFGAPQIKTISVHGKSYMFIIKLTMLFKKDILKL